MAIATSRLGTLRAIVIEQAVYPQKSLTSFNWFAEPIVGRLEGRAVLMGHTAKVSQLD
jgi:hypothetical protein